MFLLSEVARIELLAGHASAAAGAIDQGLRMTDSLGGAATISLPPLLAARAQIRRDKGDFAGEAEDCRRILAIQEEQGDVRPDTPYGPDALTCLGEAELELHQAGAALAHLERSLTLPRRWDRRELPRARFALARALQMAHRDPERARAEAENAREGLRALPGTEGDLAAIDAWLAATR
jgi:hypothetical protein